MGRIGPIPGFGEGSLGPVSHDPGGSRSIGSGSVAELATLVQAPAVFGAYPSEPTCDPAPGMESHELQAPRHCYGLGAALARSVPELAVEVLAPTVSRSVGQESTGMDCSSCYHNGRPREPRDHSRGRAVLGGSVA